MPWRSYFESQTLILKILKLRFRNIHSLKGDHLVDFTIAPLRDAGLFAITGPTGAGKSTILDVITLALFNKIPRFAVKGTESISKTDIEKIGSVLTHFTDDAYAEIEYECHQQAYRSKWSISRARTGNLRDYDMELATLPDGIFKELKKSEVPAENERILGLKYEQFIRSILLSQGDFARFLKSDDKERAKLLEDITDSHIYREIGKKVFETARAKEDELKGLRLQIDMIKLYEDDLLTEKEDTLKNNRHRLKDMEDQLHILADRLAKMEQKSLLLAKKNAADGALKNLEFKKVSFGEQALKLNKHQALDTFRGSLTLWQNEKNRVTQLRKDIISFQQQASKANENVQAALLEMSVFTHTGVSETDFMAKMKAFENKVIALDGQLNTLAQAGKTTKDRLNLLLSQDNDFAKDIEKLKVTEDQYQWAMQRKAELALVPMAFDGSNAALTQSLQAMQEAIVSLTVMYKDITTQEKLSSENAVLSLQIATSESEIQAASKDVLVFAEKVEQLKYALDDANEKKQHWLKIATLDDHRHALRDGSPCPLCGALHHPYTESLPQKIGEYEILIQQLTDQLAYVTQQDRAVKTNIAIGQSTIQNHQKRVGENTSYIEKIKESYRDNLQSSAQIQQEVETKKALSIGYQQEAKVRAEKEFLESLTTVLSELQDITAQYRTVQHTRKSQYTGNDINGDADKIQNAFVAAKETFQSLQVALSISEKEAAEATSRWQNIQNGLMDSLLDLGYQDPQAAIQSILPDDDLRRILQQKDGLIKEETELNNTLQQIAIDLGGMEDIATDDDIVSQQKAEYLTLNKQKAQLHEESGAIENEMKNQTLLRKQYQALRETLRQMEEKATPIFHLNLLIGDATGNKYAKFAQNLSLKHLLSLANLRLAKLTDRYLLAETDIEDDLKITDLYQGNTLRSVKTLSGGETFIVSLALALSLADMASQNVRLDSLFIDEGFGTLDQETMEIALITLEKLQSEGNRTIGIISHVESLKERITTQIKVHKDNLGYSKIEVV